MKHLILLSSVVLAITGCAPAAYYSPQWITPEQGTPIVPVNSNEETQENNVEVTIVRAQGNYGSAITFRCFVDSVPIAVFDKPGQVATIYVEPGIHGAGCTGSTWLGPKDPSLHNTFKAKDNDQFVFQLGTDDGATVLSLQSKNGKNISNP